MTETLKVQRLTETATLPTRAHADDAGMDLRADGEWELYPYESCLVDTGVAVAIPPEHVGMVVPRSGLAAMYAVTVLNAPGIVDAGYTGQVKVNLFNHGEEVYKISHGNRIAQLVITPIITPDVQEVYALEPTERGDNGHGSTGQ